jgi:hypothetical protein
MGALRVVVWAWRSAGALFPRPRIWLPFLLIGGVQAAALLLIVSFYHPALLHLGDPLIRLLAGKIATHYPVLYYALPTMFYRLNIVIDALIASIAGGAATLLFATAFGIGQERRPWNRAIRRAPTLVLATLVATALVLGFGALTTLVPKELTARSFAIRWGVRGATMLVFILVQGLLVYATAWIVLMGHRLWPALRDSVRVALRTFLPTMIVVAITQLVLFPFQYAGTRADLVASKLKPEMVGSLLAAQIVCQVLVTFLLVGAITRLFLWRVEATR